MFRLSFYPIVNSYLLVIAVAIALLALLAWGPAKDRAGRAAAGGAGPHCDWPSSCWSILAMLRPTLIYTQTKKQWPRWW